MTVRNWFGDSLYAAASSQLDPGRTYCPWLVSMLLGAAAPNVYAIGGNLAADQAAPIYNKPIGDENFILVGTDDRLTYRNGGVTDPNGVALFQNEITALSYWLSGSMLTTQSAGWTSSGFSNYVSPGHPWAAIGKYAAAAGATLSVNFPGGLLLIGYTMADGGATGSATVKINGATVGTINCTPPRVISGGAGHSAYAPGVFRLTDQPAGTLTITTNSSAIVMIDWANINPLVTSTPTYLLTLPKTANGDDTEVAAYNLALLNAKYACSGDGYNVATIGTGAVVGLDCMCSNSAPGTNNYHPTNNGHLNMATEIVAEIGP